MRLRVFLPALALIVQSMAGAQPDAGASQLLTVSPQAFLDACRADVAKAKASAAELTTSPAGGALAALDLYDTANRLLMNAAGRAGLAREVHPHEALRQAASACEREVGQAQSDLSLDRAIHDALAGLDVSSSDEPTKYYVERTLRDFRRAGVDRDEATRSRIKALREELVELGQQFQANIASDVRTIELDPAELDGLPDDYRRGHPADPNGKVVLTTRNTDYQPFVLYATSARAREAYWKLYRLRGHPKNGPVLARMLEARRELAGLLGFATWADYITADKMVETRQAAADFIEKIAAAADRRLHLDYEALLSHRRRDAPGAERVDAWDTAFLLEQVKAELHGFDSQQVRPYFEYGRVKQGILDFASRMFGLTFRPVADAALWHPDVEAFDVLEGTSLLGRIYLDMFPRENKYTHYATFPFITGRRDRLLPEGVLVCNFPKPGAGPALMQHWDVRTFFHEFGHLLHHILGGHTRWAGISGIANEFDFVEVPSQLLEEWAWAAEALQTFARHYQTGELIPADLVRRMKAADEVGKGLYVRQQMALAATSLELHTRDPEGLDIVKVFAEMQNRYTPISFVEGTHFEASFTHLDGYSALFYTYMWSLVIAKDLFAVFTREGLFDPDAAERYRRTVLEPGGSKPAADLVRDFLGRPFTFSAYEAWLNAK